AGRVPRRLVLAEQPRQIHRSYWLRRVATAVSAAAMPARAVWSAPAVGAPAAAVCTLRRPEATAVSTAPVPARAVSATPGAGPLPGCGVAVGRVLKLASWVCSVPARDA